ncbi:hypothetical protein LXA43DRAFT_351954 [Ganoderma leucocontextum]|nr:hypothetical protein LXA43DRAFT_351954 [Ganoderma leucocontextum]
MAEHQNHNRLLRELYGSTACNLVYKTKSHIRALRSAYNYAAPINHHLPPEVLMEIFSNVHPTVVPRQRSVPVLRVCRYWRKLVLKTPQFWANLLSLPIWDSWDMCRIRVAVARSAPQSLTVSVPYHKPSVVDILVPHASRFSSLEFPLFETKYLSRILEQDMPRLRHLAICSCPNLTLSFPRYPNIRSLQLERTKFYHPIAPCTSLRHLKLKCCNIHPPSSGSVSLVSVHDTLDLFPNLETLYMAYGLSHEPELMKTIHLPRLRRLEVVDVDIYFLKFLSHLVFPSTTSLVLKLLAPIQGPLEAPVFPGINPSHAPDAELSFTLDFLSLNRFTYWETHGEGVRPIRIAVAGPIRRHATIIPFTHALVLYKLSPPRAE